MTKHDNNIYPFFSLYDGKAYLKKRPFPAGAAYVEHRFKDTYRDSFGRVTKVHEHLYTAICDANYHTQAVDVFEVEYFQRSMLGGRAQNVELRLDDTQPHFNIWDWNGKLHSISLAGRPRAELTDEVLTKLIEGAGRHVFKHLLSSFEERQDPMRTDRLVGSTITESSLEISSTSNRVST